MMLFCGWPPCVFVLLLLTVPCVVLMQLQRKDNGVMGAGAGHWRLVEGAVEALAASRPPPLHRPRASPFLLALLSYHAAAVAEDEAAKKDANGMQQ